MTTPDTTSKRIDEQDDLLIWDSIDKILDDAYELGKTDATLPSANDYPVIMPKMKAKARSLIDKEVRRARIDELHLIVSDPRISTTSHIYTYAKNRIAELQNSDTSRTDS